MLSRLTLHIKPKHITQIYLLEISQIFIVMTHGEETTNVHRPDSTLDDDPQGVLRAPQTFFDIFFVNFCNIRYLHFNFQCVEHNQSSTNPHLFLTKTQVLEATGCNLYPVSS